MNTSELPPYAAEFEQEIADFRDYLDDQKSPLAASKSLTKLLRTDPPIEFGTERVVEVVLDWAEARAARTGQKVSDLLVSSVRHIIDGFRIRAIEGFRPKDFYPVFKEGILAGCPLQERAFLEIGLRDLQQRSRDRKERAAVDFLPLGIVVVGGHRTSYEGALIEFIKTAESEPDMSDEKFEGTFYGLKRLLLEHENVPIQTNVLRVAGAGVLAFNAGEVERAGNLFDLTTESLARLGLSPNRARDVRASIKSAQLDVGRFLECINDPKRHAEVGPIVRFFADLDTAGLLGQLANERNPARSRLIVNIIALHGREALRPVFDSLSPSNQTPRSTDFTVNLLYLIARIGVSTADERKMAARVAGPLLTNTLPAIRKAAAEALAHGGGREVLPFAMRVLETVSYGQAAPEATDEMQRHVSAVMDLVVSSRSDEHVATLAEYAAGSRDGGFKWGRPLQMIAIQALAKRKKPLPRAGALAVVGALRSFTSTTRRLFFRTGGQDTELGAALITLVEDSPEPEAIEILTVPAIVKIAAQRNGT